MMTVTNLIPESRRSTKMTQKSGTRAAAADKSIEMDRLMNTVLFLPNSSVRNPEMWDEMAIPKKVTLDRAPLRNVSNSSSHIAAGRI